MTPPPKPTAMQSTPAQIKEVDNLLSTFVFDEAEKQQLAAIDAMQQVCHLLGITESQYQRFSKGIARRYLVYLTDHNHYLITDFLKCPLFWAWWDNQFKIRNQQFIATDFGDHCSAQWANIYADLNDPYYLTTQIRPTQVIWEAVLNKEEKK